ncbi:MAG: hypothetical protein JRI55_18090, partial [Deltaproteobacteria bacterium]|nr:hypothetical protein [Deltaproteobacteria bacterium]
MVWEERQGWLLLLIVSGLVISAPFLVVEITPITDVAQQLAQIPLLGQVLSGQAPDLVVHWLHPNKASYLPLAASWLLFEPLRAARMALVLIALVWVAAVFVIARRRGRSASSAILALPLVFNHSFGLGFLNFSVGLGAFAYWFLTLANLPAERSERSTFFHVLVGSLLLYYSHALWLAGGLVWLAAITVWQWRPARVVIAQLLGAAPVIILAATWYPSLIEMKWGASLPFGAPGVERLGLASLVDASLGSVRGPLEPLVLVGILLWIVTALWQHRRGLREAIDLELVATGALFLAFALLLPDKVDR